MDSVRSVLNLKKSYKYACVATLFCLSITYILPAPRVYGQGAATGLSFTEARNRLVNLIGGAKARVWLVTDYISDGDIVGALHVARYRRRDVVSFVGKDMAHAYLSRFNNLKKNNIAVFYRPNLKGFSEPTLILIDQQLYQLNADLDARSSKHTISLIKRSDIDARNFYAALLPYISRNPKAIKNVSRPIPKPQINKVTAQPSDTTPRVADAAQLGGGPFNYDRMGQANRHTVDQDIPRQLPKVPVYQRNQRANVAVFQDPAGPVNTETIINPALLHKSVVPSLKCPECQ